MYDQIKRLRSQGLSWKQIGEQLEEHPEKVRGVFRRNTNKGSEPNYRVTKEVSLPSEHLSLDALIERRLSDTKRRLAGAQSTLDWLPFELKDDVALIAVIGDPHLDDNYCNFDVLKQHVDLFRNNPDIFAVPIGDTSNNWVGRLQKEYADQDTTKTQSLQLIEWFFDSIKPRVHTTGNHDNWSAQESLIKYLMSKQTGFDASWQARCVLQFPNGFNYKCWFAHDFPGKSKTNPNYSEIIRLSNAGEHVHLLAAGHRHYWAIQQSESEWSGEKYTLVRAKGYKDYDDYANTLGYGQQRSGHTIGVVVDSRDRKSVAFEDLHEAFDYYKYRKDS